MRHFTCGISLSADEKFYIISTSDHITSEEYFFPQMQRKIQPVLFQKRKTDVRYSIDSWKNFFMCIQMKMPEIIKFLSAKLIKLII